MPEEICAILLTVPAVGCFTAHVAIAVWAFLYTEICNSVYINKLQSKNNLQILHFLLTKKLLAEIIKNTD